MARQRKTRVNTPAGRRGTRAVMALRLASAAATGAAIVAAGTLLDGAGAGALSAALAFALLAGVAATAEYVVAGRSARAEERRIRRTVLTRQFAIAESPTALRDEFGPARVIQMATDGIERVTEFKQVYWGSTLAAVLIPPMVLCYIGFAIDPVVGFTVLVLVPVIPLAIRGFMKLFRKTSAHSRKQRAKLAGRYLDAIRNLVTIRMLGAGARIEADLRRAGEENRGAIMRLLAGNQRVIIVMDGVFSLVLICATALITIARRDAVSLGEAATIMMLVVLLLEPLQQVAGFFYIGMGGMASLREIRAFLDATGGEEIYDASPPVTAAPAVAGESGGAGSGEDGPGAGLSLGGVRFDYGRGEVLRGVDLAVPVGGRVAIVGKSGAGKTTILRLLRGTLPPQQGRVRIGRHESVAGNLAATRAASAVVGQSTWLFTGTIADNLAIARPDATPDQMWAALREAHVADEVAAMPDGLDTYLGEGGALVSGGQAQRLSLARALLSGRPVLLLDEPTSHVDIESEAAMLAAVAALPRDRTIVMISHRPTLLHLADTVCALADGRLQAKESIGV